jgi:hypothetical protein
MQKSKNAKIENEKWKNGKIVKWKIGKIDKWKNAKIEKWKKNGNAQIESRKMGKMEKS